MKTEKEKMLGGELYLAYDPVLVEERKRAKRLLKQYNDSPPHDAAGRLAVLKQLFGTIGSRIEVEPSFYCDYGHNIHVGENFYANTQCVILDCAAVTIGANVFLAPGVHIYTATHPLDPETRNSGLEAAHPVQIGDNVWIGGGAIINPGVSIGAGSTIGAGSVVTRDIPADVLAVGNPCRVIRAL